MWKRLNKKYYINFVGEGSWEYVYSGRGEVWTRDAIYAEREFRFNTNDSRVCDLIDKWDLKMITARRLAWIEEQINKYNVSGKN